MPSKLPMQALLELISSHVKEGAPASSEMAPSSAALGPVASPKEATLPLKSTAAGAKSKVAAAAATAQRPLPSGPERTLPAEGKASSGSPGITKSCQVSSTAVLPGIALAAILLSSSRPAHVRRRAGSQHAVFGNA